MTGKRELKPLIRELAQNQGILTGCLIIFALIYTLYFAKALLMPIFLAVLMALLLRPCVRSLKRLAIPEGLAAALVMILILVGIGWVLIAISGPAGDWIERGPSLRAELEAKFRTLSEPLQKVQEVTENLQEAASMSDEGPQTVVIEGPSLLQRIFVEAQSTLVSAVVVLTLVFFLLARGSSTRRRVEAAIRDERQRQICADTLNAIKRDLAFYLLTVSVINACLAVVISIAMWLHGLPNPLLWGVIGGVLNFIPYAGAVVTFAIITGVSVLTFDHWLAMVLPAATFLLITFIEGQFVSPLVVGRRLTLDPIAIFLSVLAWGWLWGLAGMLLAVPILASIKITVGAVKSLAPFAALIDSGENGDQKDAV